MSVKVSVIVPVYNVEEYLNECLDSLLNQTLQEIEVICVDDGSTDRSLDILNEYAEKDARVKVLTQKNQYAGVARNNGMKVATGEYLIFLDSDDFFDPQLCEKAYLKGKEHDADIVIFGSRKYDHQTKEFFVDSSYYHTEIIKKTPVFSRKDYPKQILSITNVAPWTKAFKREFIAREKLQYQGVQFSNDVYFSVVAMSVASRIAWMEDELVNYRVGLKTNLQSKKSRKPTCFLEAYKAAFDELNRRGIYSEVEHNFVHIVLAGTVFNLKTSKTFDAAKQIYKYIGSDDFKSMNILGYPDSFYVHRHNHKEILRASYIAEELNRNEIRKKNDSSFTILKHAQCDSCQVSVVIPIYNVEEFLDESLNSIQKQSLKDIEIICVVDGATDNSLQIVENHAKEDSRIAIVVQENMGQSAARNHGISIAKGEYLYFMDSDDILDSQALEECMKQINKYDLDVLYFDGISFGDPKKVEEYEGYYLRTHDYPECTRGIDLYCQLNQNNEFRVSPCLQVIRKSLLEKNQIAFHERIIHEDNAFTLLVLISAEKAGHLSKVFFHRRFRSESTMTSHKSFRHTYGYFTVAMDMMQRKDLYLHYSEDERKAIYDMVSRMLWNSVNDFKKLREEERSAYLGLDVDEAVWFDSLVVQRAKNGGVKVTPPQAAVKPKPKPNPKKKKPARKKWKRKHPPIYYVYKIAERSPEWLVVFVKKIFDVLHIPY